MLIHPDYEGRVTQDWFNAATWGDQARPVSSGGRGGAWFLQAGEDKPRTPSGGSLVSETVTDSIPGRHHH